MGAIYRVDIEKRMENTGTFTRPFYVKGYELREYYLFGIKIKSASTAATYPDKTE